ncbi:MAG TPA: hypothetical protein DDY62_00385, partial [Cryomorphaceae bacterium]|nr:hypothetical protein [Cryomorphaceae bacterium]
IHHLAAWTLRKRIQQCGTNVARTRNGVKDAGHGTMLRRDLRIKSLTEQDVAFIASTFMEW